MEFLLRIVDKEASSNPAIAALRSRAGDVIVVVEDGWAWSDAEMTNPDWVVIKVPGQPVTALDDMMIPDIDATVEKRLLQRRANRFDLARPAVITLLSNKRVITLGPALWAIIVAAKKNVSIAPKVVVG